MHEIRKDVVRDNWVITATEFVLKPRDVPVKKLSADEGGPVITPTVLSVKVMKQ